MKKIITVLVLAALAGGILGFAVFEITKYVKKEEAVPTEFSDVTRFDANGCYVEEFFAYSGEYPEDGSFEPAENVAAIRIRNNLSVDIRYAEITVKAGVEEYVFLASSWLAGSEMTVLESAGKKVSGSLSFDSAEITSVGTFEKKPSLLEDRFEIKIENGVISVKNLTENDFPDGLTVYFKATDENGCFGGMTFRAALPGITAGGTETVSAGLSTEKELVPVFAEER